MATKAAKKATAKAEINTGIEQIKKSATTVNKAVTATVDKVAKDVADNSKVVKNVAEKAAKDLTNKVDFKASAKQIKSTVEVVNTQLKETAGEVADSVVKSTRQMSEVAVKTAQNTIRKMDVEKGIQTVASTAKSVNEYSLKTADQMIDGVLVNGERWSKVAEKAINGGLKIAEKNQEIVFSTLETVKTQVVHSAIRFGKLFSKN